MDWMLTNEEMRTEWDNALCRYQQGQLWQRGIGLADYMREGIARAAVKKVVGAWEAWSCDTSEEDPCPRTNREEAYCIACKAQVFMQALKAAGEGK